MVTRYQVISILCFIFLASCQSPSNSIEGSIKQYKKEYPNNFNTYHSAGRKMQYAWSGDETKRPLLFVHGSPGSYEGWSEFLLNPSLQKKFHLIAIDRPGYGGSENGHTETSLQKQALDIVQALNSNQSGQKAILIGHSMGGPIIARIAMDHPDKVAGLIFVSSSVDPQLESIKWYQHIATWPVFRWALPNWLRVCNEEIMPLQHELELMQPLWKSIKAKTIIIHGDKDDLVPFENMAFLESHISAELILKTDVLSGMNHFVPWKKPDSILNAITLLISDLYN